MTRGRAARPWRCGTRAAIRAAGVLVLLAGCAPQPVPETPAPEGTALANCTREIARRGGGSARITDVRLFEEQRGIITARGAFREDYTCFTDPQGRAVNVIVDRPPSPFARG